LAQYTGTGGACAYGEEVEGSREVSRVPAPRDAKPNQPVKQHTQAQHQEVPKQTRQCIRKCREVISKQIRYSSRKYLNTVDKAQHQEAPKQIRHNIRKYVNTVDVEQHQ
jgi:hypothetical protein